MELTESRRQIVLLALIILSLICLCSSFLIFMYAVNIKTTIDARIALLETYNSETIPGLFLFVGVVNLVENGSCAFISSKLRSVDNRERLMKTMLPLLVGGIVLVIIEISSSIASLVHISILNIEFKEGIEKAMKQYVKGGELKREIDFVQTTYECCGDSSYTDWFLNPWIDPSHLVTTHTKYLQNNGLYYSDDTPYSCCDKRAVRPCIHHHIHDNHRHYNYDYKVETTLHVNGCRPALVALYSSILISISIISLATAALKIVILLLFRLTNTSLVLAQQTGDWTETTPAYIFYIGDTDTEEEDKSGESTEPESETEDEGGVGGGNVDGNETKTDDDVDDNENAGDEKGEGDDFNKKKRSFTFEILGNDVNEIDEKGDDKTADNDATENENVDVTNTAVDSDVPTDVNISNVNPQYDITSNPSSRSYTPYHHPKYRHTQPIEKLSWNNQSTYFPANGNSRDSSRSRSENLSEIEVAGGGRVRINKTKVADIVHRVKSAFTGHNGKRCYGEGGDYSQYKYSTLKSQQDTDSSQDQDDYLNDVNSPHNINPRSGNKNYGRRIDPDLNFRNKQGYKEKRRQKSKSNKHNSYGYLALNSFDKYSNNTHDDFEKNVSHLFPVENEKNHTTKDAIDLWQPLSLNRRQGDKEVVQFPGYGRDKHADISGVSNGQVITTAEQKSIINKIGADGSYRHTKNDTTKEHSFVPEGGNPKSSHAREDTSKSVRRLFIDENPELEFRGDSTRLPPPVICETTMYKTVHNRINRPQPALATNNCHGAVIVEHHQAGKIKGTFESRKNADVLKRYMKDGHSPHASKHLSTEYDLIPTIQRRGYDHESGNGRVLRPDIVVDEISPEVANINFPRKLDMDCSIEIDTQNRDFTLHHVASSVDFQETSISHCNKNTHVSRVSRTCEEKKGCLTDKPAQRDNISSTKLNLVDNPRQDRGEKGQVQCLDKDESFGHQYLLSYGKKNHIRSNGRKNIFLASPIVSTGLDTSVSSADDKPYPVTSTPVENGGQTRVDNNRRLQYKENDSVNSRTYLPPRNVLSQAQQLQNSSLSRSHERIEAVHDLIDLSDTTTRVEASAQQGNDRSLTLISPFN